MKIYVEADLEAIDRIMVEGLKTLITDIKNSGCFHAEDINYEKKLRKAANILLDYYGY